MSSLLNKNKEGTMTTEDEKDDKTLLKHSKAGFVKHVIIAKKDKKPMKMLLNKYATRAPSSKALMNAPIIDNE